MDQPRMRTDFRRYATRIDYSNVSLSRLVIRAYGDLPSYRIAWPDRLETEKWVLFTIQATFPEGATEAQIREMLQRLLEDRFALRTHWEKKAMQGYEATVAPGGVKMSRSDYDPPKILDPDDNTPLEERNRNRYSFGAGVMFGIMNIDQMVYSLGGSAGRPIINKTSLRGYYDIDFRWNQPYTPPPPLGQPVTLGEASVPNGTDTKHLFAEMEKQLGLKVEPARLELDVLVLDHIERMPTEN